MTTAPKRRWFRFGLLFSLPSMVLVGTIAAGVAWWTNDLWDAPDPNEWVSIASVGDGRTAWAIVELLTANEIECSSVTYGVEVRQGDAPRACKLIHDAGPKLGPYQNWIADY